MRSGAGAFCPTGFTFFFDLEAVVFFFFFTDVCAAGVRSTGRGRGRTHKEYGP